MSPLKSATPLLARRVPPNRPRTTYPAPFAGRMDGREDRALGNLLGLKNFGVNLTCLAPGGMSALRHAHSLQNESPTTTRQRKPSPVAGASSTKTASPTHDDRL